MTLALCLFVFLQFNQIMNRWQNIRSGTVQPNFATARLVSQSSLFSITATTTLLGNLLSDVLSDDVWKFM
jgi:hypothetical protein